MTIALKDKVVLITGASSGFGMDSARLFAAEGARVVLSARRIDRLQDEADRLQTAGGQAMAIPVDVTNPAEVQSMVKTVIENYGTIDILFNNAGMGRLDWFDNLQWEHDITTQINVNLLGLMSVTHTVLPYMINQRSGHIINMSSVAGLIAPPMYSVYAASKYAVRGFTEALRREVRTYGIHVSGIYPGPAHTEFGQNLDTDFLEKKFKVPEFAYMTSEYVARRVIKLAQYPRRSLILPWWFNPVLWADSAMPGLVDWVINHFFVKRYR